MIFMNESSASTVRPSVKKVIVFVVLIILIGVGYIFYLFHLYSHEEKTPGEIKVVFEPEVDMENATKIIHENNCTIKVMRNRTGTISATVKVPEGHEEEYIAIFESYAEVRYAEWPSKEQ